MPKLKRFNNLLLAGRYDEAEALLTPALVPLITHLDLSAQKLFAVPQVLQHLTQLEELDLRYNKLTTIPDFLLKLPKLDALYIGGTKIRDLSAFQHCEAPLKHLDLVDLKISKAHRSGVADWLPDCKIVFKY